MTNPTVYQILRHTGELRSGNVVDIEGALQIGMRRFRLRMLATYAAAVLVVGLITAAAVAVHFASPSKPLAVSGQLTTTSSSVSTSTPVTTTGDLGSTAPVTTTSNGQSSAITTTTTTTSVNAAPALTLIRVTPAELNLPVGQSGQLTATGSYSDGSTADLTQSVTWTTGDAAIATVDGSGKVTATGVAARAGVGKTDIRATFGDQSGGAAVISTAPRSLTGITVSPQQVTNCGGSVSLTATGTYSDGGTADITGTVEWSSNNTAFATVDSSGHVTVQPLTSQGPNIRTYIPTLAATITANSGTQSGRATVTCIPSR